MGYGSRYYPDRWNPYNRHDTGMYLVYRKSDAKIFCGYGKTVSEKGGCG